MSNALKPGGRIYITVHRDSKKKTPGESGKDKWQNHMTPDQYLKKLTPEEIDEWDEREEINRLTRDLDRYLELERSNEEGW